jgi:hypothetical protein
MEALTHATADQRAIFAEACETFGIDPTATPREVLSLAFYGDAAFLESLAVVIVTGGGQRLRWPVDARTEEQLRKIFGLLPHDPLPRDLRLPPEMRHGYPAPAARVATATASSLRDMVSRKLALMRARPVTSKG